MSKFCSNCGEELPEGSKFCPNCGFQNSDLSNEGHEEGVNLAKTEPIQNNLSLGQTEQKPKKKRGKGCLTAFIVFGVACVVICVIVGVGTSSNTTNATATSASVDKSSTASPAASPTQTASKPDLEVISHSSENDGYTGYIVGEIKNNTDKTYTYVEVDINLYNGDTLVGSTLDNVNNLEAGQTWNFKAVVMENNVTSYKITGVTGY